MKLKYRYQASLKVFYATLGFMTAVCKFTFFKGIHSDECSRFSTGSPNTFVSTQFRVAKEVVQVRMFKIVLGFFFFVLLNKFIFGLVKNHKSYYNSLEMRNELLESILQFRQKIFRDHMLI